MLGFLKKLFGDPDQRVLERLQPLVEEVNALEPTMQAKSDMEFQALTREFQGLIQAATADDRAEIGELEERVYREQDADRRRELRREIERVRKRMDDVERTLLDEIMPEGLPFELANVELTKKNISRLINSCYRQLGLKDTVVFADKLMYTGFAFATRAGVSIGIRCRARAAFRRIAAVAAWSKKRLTSSAVLGFNTSENSKTISSTIVGPPQYPKNFHRRPSCSNASLGRSPCSPIA